MKIFVTGATGFIGTHLCHRLVGEGHEVFALVRSPKKRGKLPGTVTVIKGDLTIFEQADLQLPEVDIVIHLAGVIAARTQADYFKINFEAVKQMAGYFEKQKIPLSRFVFASSLAAAGPSKGTQALTEEMDLAPVDNYGLAKKMAEEFLDSSSLRVTSFRPAIVFGPGDENSLTLFKMAKRGIAMRIPGQDQVVSFIDIEDLISAICLMMVDKREGHQRYFVTHEMPVVISELWKLLGEQFGKRVFLAPIPKPLLYGVMKISTFVTTIFGLYNQLDEKQYRQIVTPAFVCSGKKLRTELGWEAVYDLEASVKKAIVGYRGAGQL